MPNDLYFKLNRVYTARELEKLEDMLINYDRIKAENEKLKACVEFYADKDNWRYDYEIGAYDTIKSRDLDFSNVAGELARKTLLELKTNSSESSVIKEV